MNDNELDSQLSKLINAGKLILCNICNSINFIKNTEECSSCDKNICTRCIKKESKKCVKDGGKCENIMCSKCIEDRENEGYIAFVYLCDNH